MATYRSLQADFTAGELDPMIEANISLGIRTMGLKSSQNAFHLPTGPVSKRAPSRLLCSTDSIDIQATAEVQLSEGLVHLIFTRTHVHAFFKDAIFEGETLQKDHSSSMFAVNRNMVVETDGKSWPMLYEVSISDDAPIVTITEMDDSRMTGWKWGEKPRACAFAGGRLFFGFGSTVVASRTPEDGKDRFFDFTLADFSYEWKMTYANDNINGWKYKDVYDMSNDTGIPDEPFDPLYTGQLSDVSKRTRNVSKLEMRINRIDITSDEDPDKDTYVGQYLYLRIDYLLWKSWNTNDPETIINNFYGTAEVKSWTAANFTFSSGMKSAFINKDVALEYAESFQVEYIITDNYTDGEIDTTTATMKSKQLSDANYVTTAEAVDIYPDIGYEDALDFEIKDEQEKPNVFVSHGIEINETDMYSSEILWIANMGRIIIGTANAIFISTDDIIVPSTFDLRPTLYDGSAPMQPKILHSLLLYVSTDGKKIYGAIYSNETQGLQSTEITIYSRHLFLDGIRMMEMVDTPYRTIYALTRTGNLRVGTMMTTENGFYFAFSTWRISSDSIDALMIDRQNDTRIYLILSNVEEPNIQQVHAIEYKEPYEYGLSGVELMMDHQQEITITSRSFVIPDRFLSHLSSVDAILTKTDGKKEVIRGIPIMDGTCTIGEGYVKALIGTPVSMEIQLFQQYLPNNSGTILQSKHSVSEIAVQIFRSVGGEIWYNGSKVKSLLQLQYGTDIYGKDFIDPDTGQPYSFTGVYGVANPTQNTLKDELVILSSEPYPFNIMGVAIKYNVTEVN